MCVRSGGGGSHRPVPDIVESSNACWRRALRRLDYDELLEFTPDPLGDWVAGRFDRLVHAELDEVGLARMQRR